MIKVSEFFSQHDFSYRVKSKGIIKQLAKCFFLACLLAFSLKNSLYSATPNRTKYQGTIRERGDLITGTRTMVFRLTNADGFQLNSGQADLGRLK